MKLLKYYILSLILVFYSFNALAESKTNLKEEITKTGQIWQQALASRDANKISKLYSPNAYLYPTFDNMIDDHAALLEYFQKLTLNQNLKVVFDKEHIQVYGNVGINSGLYTFSYKQNGKEVTVSARYTFVYLHQGKNWLIIDHHSSVLPKPPEENNTL